MKMMTILGTRPELIRLSRTIALLENYSDHKLVHTGQNYDYELNEIFFKDLKIKKPDYFLNADITSLGNVLGTTLIKIEEVLKKEKPDGVLILGDTNSSIACIMAKRLKIPVYHMEAGNRCFDQNVPEEINRVIIDHIADFNLVYTEHARRNLLHEGLPPRRIYLSGSPMKEVLDFYAKQIEISVILDKLKLKNKGYFLFSFHREENVDNEVHLKSIIEILKEVKAHFSKKIVISTHPRTQKRLDALNIKFKGNDIMFLKPFGFFDYIKLQQNAICTISDSGTISEESAILNFPAITLREAMERPEAMDTGSIILTGFDKETVLNAIDVAVKVRPQKIPDEYLFCDCSQRVMKIILGTIKLSNAWAGIKK